MAASGSFALAMRVGVSEAEAGSGPNPKAVGLSGAIVGSDGVKGVRGPNPENETFGSTVEISATISEGAVAAIASWEALAGGVSMAAFTPSGSGAAVAVGAGTSPVSPFADLALAGA